MVTENDRLLKVLHVEDDPGYARLVTEALASKTSLRCKLVRAETLAEAVIRLENEAFDAALVDLSLPDGNGLQICRTLLKYASDKPLVVLTAGDEDEPALAALDAGMQDYLVKGRTDAPALARALVFANERMRLGTNSHPAPEADSRRILAIVDNQDDLAQLEDGLSGLTATGWELVCVGRLSLGLERLGADTFSLAIVDLALPDSRGVETCVALGQTARSVPFVVYAGSADDGLAVKTIQHGASDYLTKAWTDRTTLSRRIQFALRRHRPSSEPVPAAIGHDRAAASRSRADHANAIATADPRSAASLAGGPVECQPRIERRRPPRYPLVCSVVAIPVTPEGRPDWPNRRPGVTFDLSTGGIGLELSAAEPLATNTLVIGVERRDGQTCYTGVQVHHMQHVAPGRLRLGGKFGGRGEEILSPANLTPTVDVSAMRVVRRIAEEILLPWVEVGVLQSILLDRVDFCPRCRGLPTFRLACRSCGSARTSAPRMIHHFACAHVALAGDFEQSGGLRCPKCRAQRLIVGTDFEYQNGPNGCQDCYLRNAELDHVGQCLRCGFRFPGQQSLTLDLVGYYAHRLDPLAFISAP